MPVTLRRRLQCHYCGKRLNSTRRINHQIQCESCLADNFFDADNNIIDVPLAEATTSSTASQPTEIESDSSIFCKTCLTNQSFYVRALADYLPDEDDPRYEEFENALPEFKKELDLRYPRCCAQCEPRVQTQIQQANYAAKADHLRRLMHRKHGRRKSPDLQLRSWLIGAAGVGYVASLSVQLLWHLLAAQLNTDHVMPTFTPRDCLSQWPMPAQCTHYAATGVPLSLVTALLCIWWNPKWQHRLMGKEGRLVGLRKYYLLQTSLLTLRFVAWAFLTDLQTLQLYAPAMHTVVLALLLILSLYSCLAVIQVDTTPLVDWQQSQPSLLSANQFQPPVPQLYSPPMSQTSSTFQIESLAGPTHPTYDAWRPPTPPTEDDGMDWTPSSQEFNPRPQPPKQRFDQQSPFFGTLPAPPVRGSLNPKISNPLPKKRAIGIPPGFFGLSKNNNQPPQKTSSSSSMSVLAPARFFAHERDADTGLENIFDKMFSVRDPLEIPAQSRGTELQKQSQMSSSAVPHELSQSRRSISSTHNQAGPPMTIFLSISILVALAVILSSLCSLELLYGATTSTPSTILPYTSIIPVAHLMEQFIFNKHLTFSNLFISMLEICVSTIAYFCIPVSGSEFVPMWNKMVIGLISLLLLQEVYHFCQIQSKPVSQAATAHMLHSMDRAEQNLSHETVIAPATLPLSPQLQTPSASSSQMQISGGTRTSNNLRHQLPLPAETQTRSFGDFGTIRKRDSDESISSVSSIQTTSTTSAWNTPRQENKISDWRDSDSTRTPNTNISRGLGGLSLSNDFGTGTGVAGPRTRQTQPNVFGRYR